MRCVVVIPARMGASRFPGKPLADLCGKPMVRWVWEAAQAAEVADRIVVATPDPEIVYACALFGAEAVLTSPDCPTGTDRVAEVARSLQADYYINVQGDEPLMPAATIATCARLLAEDPTAQLATMWTPCSEAEEPNPAVVKVVTDLQGFGLLFSRWAIPYPRNPRSQGVKKHLGLYGYRREPLLAFSCWAPTPLETAESLEQLRFMEHGYRFKLAEGAGSELAVDTPEQAEEVRAVLRSRGA